MIICPFSNSEGELHPFDKEKFDSMYKTLLNAYNIYKYAWPLASIYIAASAMTHHRLRSLWSINIACFCFDLLLFCGRVCCSSM